MKTQSILFALILLLFVQCKKREDFEHEPGYRSIEQESQAQEESFTSSWELVENSPENIRCMEVFEGYLYLGLEDEDSLPLLMMYNGNQIKGALEGSFTGFGIYDLCAIRDTLWVGGGYSFFDGSKSSKNLMCIKNGNINHFTLGFSFEPVYSIAEYEQYVAIGGEFSAVGDSKSENLEVFAGTKAIGGYSTISTVHGIATLNGTLFIGIDPIAATNYGSMGIYNQSWKYYYFGQGSFIDVVHSLAFYKDEIYVAGSLDYKDEYLIITNGNQYWTNSNLSVAADKPFRLKNLNGALYVFGQGIGINGTFESNVVRLKNNIWESVGNLKIRAQDIVFFNGELYAATEIGLFKYNGENE